MFSSGYFSYHEEKEEHKSIQSGSYHPSVFNMAKSTSSGKVYQDKERPLSLPLCNLHLLPIELK